MIKHLTDNNLLERHQSVSTEIASTETASTETASTETASTETAFVLVQNDIPEALDRRCGIILVLLDMSAAFDTVEYEILLSRLKQRFGMSGPALMWMRSYLSDRSQSVNLPGGVSSKSSVACGVP